MSHSTAQTTTGIPKSGEGAKSQPSVWPDISAATFKKWLVIIGLIGLALRVAFFVEHSRTASFGVPTLDQTYYDTVAKMLLNGEDLHSLHGFRPLLYPLFLACCYKLGGAWGTDLALLAQHVLGVATGLIAGILGARIFRHYLSGLASAALFLLAPVPLYFEGELLIEPSYIFLIFVGLWLILRAAEAPTIHSLWLWSAAGALTVLTSQARANILVFMAVYPLFAAWRGWNRHDFRACLPPLLGLVGGLTMAVPWGLVNMKQMDHFHLLPNAGGVAFYCGNKRTADGMVPEQDRRVTTAERYEDSIEVWARQDYEAAMLAQGRKPDSDPMAISRYWTAQTIKEIEASPASWLRLMLKKSWLTLWNVEVPNNKAFAFLQREFLILRLLPVRWVILLILTPAGIWASWRWGSRDALFVVAAYAALYSAANIAFFICDRYRYPVWPAMASLAGGGLVALLELIRKRQARQLCWLGGSMAILAALSLHNWFDANLPSFARDYLFRSLACYQKGYFKQALSDIDQSIQLDPFDANALHHRANVLFALNRLEDARQAYEKTLQQIPEEGSAWNNLGATLDRLGHPNEALAAFRRAFECKPPSRNAFLGAAFIQIRFGQLAEAAATIDQLEKLLAGPDAAALATRSVLERRAGRQQRSDELEQQARRLDPADAAWAIESASRATPN